MSIDRFRSTWELVMSIFGRQYDEAEGKRRMQEADTATQITLARGWLISRARNEKLRKTITLYEAHAPAEVVDRVEMLMGAE